MKIHKAKKRLPKRQTLFLMRGYILLHSLVHLNAKHGHIVCNIRDASDAEILHKDLCDIRGKERGERGAEVDILHAEVEQSEENDDGLLLVPRDVVGNRQIVDVIQAEHLFELQRDQRE